MAIPSPYLIPVATITFEEEIKRSRFITQLAHTPGTQIAKAFIRQVKEQHGAARHHCWGFVAGAPTDSMQLGFSDDGEPSGTAGKPILAQLQGSKIGEVTAVVVRYSGGIKLGTGGLVRAYGGGVKQALTRLTTKKRVAMQLLVINYEYALQGVVDDFKREFSLTIESSEFGHKAAVTVTIEAKHAANLMNKAALIDNKLLSISRLSANN
ncbi:YigZ family protein [Paraglaciecola sp. 20A4]|uniref:YigZ family protein n=1 Tax=Paraglaciecola sp. 20A4 TaxID=2687288 RepID=UPI00140B4E7C|nr:YigZ family protein [Paraglaciecola sp. 20A4]